MRTALSQLSSLPWPAFSVLICLERKSQSRTSLSCSSAWRSEPEAATCLCASLTSSCRLHPSWSHRQRTLTAFWISAWPPLSPALRAALWSFGALSRLPPDDARARAGHDLDGAPLPREDDVPELPCLYVHAHADGRGPSFLGPFAPRTGRADDQQATSTVVSVPWIPTAFCLWILTVSSLWIRTASYPSTRTFAVSWVRAHGVSS